LHQFPAAPNAARYTEPAVPPSGTSVQYSTSTAYDALNHPTSVAWNPAPAAATPTASSVTFGHAYNKANQRIGQTATDNSWLNYPAATASTVSYTSNALNQYTAVGAVTPSYDGNGNLTSDGTFIYGYDARNRLTSAVGAGNTSTYVLDAQGRRKTKTVNGTTTVFVTDADDRDVLEYDGSSGAILRWYAYGLGSNDVLNQSNVAAGTRSTLVPDIQGSIIATLDSGTATLTKASYLPYGESTNAPSSFGYTAQRIDPETNGLYYYRARHYSPLLGRFLQTDPIGYGDGGTSDLYAYVNNDPLNATDPLGLWTFQVGGSYSFNWGWIGGTFSGGLIVDGYGNAGFYVTGGGGPGVGGSVKLGGFAAITTAPTIMDTNGYNSGVSGTLGVLGGAASVDWSHGNTRDNQVYNSFGGSLGIGGGAGITQTNTGTVVIPMVVFGDPASQPPSQSGTPMSSLFVTEASAQSGNLGGSTSSGSMK